MRFRQHLELERGQKEINITPLVDMVFLLLIFFVLTSNYVIFPGIKVNLPSAATAEAVTDKNIVITLTRSNEVFVMDKKVTIEELRAYLAEAAQQKDKKILMIKADKETPLENVVRIWDLCRTSGLEQVSIATLQQ
ncbi:MAG: biopolymer transporter ExbD [Candidatus Omnitrophica bacterium]|nr:biopolymer transporter ExbD [Candidatus Omnitrophota bacterium]